MKRKLTILTSLLIIALNCTVVSANAANTGAEGRGTNKTENSEKPQRTNKHNKDLLASGTALEVPCDDTTSGSAVDKKCKKPHRGHRRNNAEGAMPMLGDKTTSNTAIENAEAGTATAGRKPASATTTEGEKPNPPRKLQANDENETTTMAAGAKNNMAPTENMQNGFDIF